MQAISLNESWAGFDDFRPQFFTILRRKSDRWMQSDRKSDRWMQSVRAYVMFTRPQITRDL